MVLCGESNIFIIRVIKVCRMLENAYLSIKHPTTSRAFKRPQIACFACTTPLPYVSNFQPCKLVITPPLPTLAKSWILTCHSHLFYQEYIQLTSSPPRPLPQTPPVPVPQGGLAPPSFYPQVPNCFEYLPFRTRRQTP